jgi:hypothetical protein
MNQLVVVPDYNVTMTPGEYTPTVIDAENINAVHG